MESEVTPPAESTEVDSPAPEGQEQASLSEETSPVEAPEKPKSKFQKLIDSKYGGNEDAFADAIFENWNSLSRFDKQISDLRNLFEESRQQQAAPNLESNPDYQELKEDISTLEAEKEENAKDRQDCISAYNSLQQELAVLKATNGSAADVRHVQAEMNRLAAQYKASERADKRIDRDKSRLERKLAQAEESIKSSRDTQKQEQQRYEREVEGYRGSFDSTVLGLLQDTGLPQQEQEDLYDIVRVQASNYIERNGPVADLGKLGAEIAAKYVGLIKRQNFQAISAAKARVAPATSTSQSPSQPSLAPKPAKVATRPRQSDAQDVDSIKNRINDWVRK